MYNQIVMDHFMNPRNVGAMEEPDGVGDVGSAVCGDRTEIGIRVEHGRITDARFRTFGCGAAIAAGSMVTELVKGMTLKEAMTITKEVVAEALHGLPPAKMHCSLLAADALHAAIADYEMKIRT